MRLVLDSLIAMMLVIILAGVVWAQKNHERKSLDHQRIHHAMARLHEQAVYRGAMGDVELTHTGFPKRIEPEWFGQDLPQNILADSHRPWIDVAPPGDMADHPPDPVLRRPEQAGLWYNPNRGIFRARVPALTTDNDTLDLYNQINHAALEVLPLSVEEARRPITHHPLPTATVRANTHPSTNSSQSTTSTTFHVEGLDNVLESIEPEQSQAPKPQTKRQSLRSPTGR